MVDSEGAYAKMNALARRMESKKHPHLSVITNEEDAAGVGRSQLRKRFELGGDSTSTTHPNVLRIDRGDRKTTRPKAPTSESNENTRPTIPTPGPRLALSAVPRRLVDERQMKGLPLDHRAAFVLMTIDGKTPVRSIIDVTGMQPEEVIVLIERLVDLRAIALL